jgi:hypothetical protein
MSCNVTEGPVEILGTRVVCNGGDSFVLDNLLEITGVSSSSLVKVTNADAYLVLSGLSITQDIPFVVNQSSVQIFLNGSTSLTARSSLHAGLECSGFSNISLGATSDGSLLVMGGSLSAGIGTAALGSCNAIQIVNGSYTISGDTAIGSGFASSSGNSVIDLIEILNATVNAQSYDGAGIGSGYSNGGTSTVGFINILGGEIKSSSGSGAGIGSGHGAFTDLLPGTSSVGSLVISGGTITAVSSSGGSGIGSGSGNSGNSLVSNIVINSVSTRQTTKRNHAGIGADSVFSFSSSAHTHSIAHGNISASGVDGSGIGSGAATYGNSSIGNLTISSGNITAIASNYGAGIGTGSVYPGNSSIGNLMISGGNFNATSFYYGAGIGTGRVIQGNSSIGNLMISGGTITAISPQFGAGIGSGVVDDGASSIENLTISGGCITAASFETGAGIGSGYAGNGRSSIGSLMISGRSIINAQGWPGIGTGYSYQGNSSIGSLAISGGDISAAAPEYAAGIGTCGAMFGASLMGNLTISGGRITAIATKYGAGIGTGCVWDGVSSIGNLTISGGNVIATSSQYGSGIGTGYVDSSDGLSSIGNLAISNAVVDPRASDYYAIGLGGGYSSSISDISIIDSNITTMSDSGSIGGSLSLRLGGRVSLALQGSSVSIDASAPIQITPNATIVACIPSGALFNQSPSSSGVIELVIMYGTATQSISRNLPYSPSVSYLQLGKVNLPVGGSWDICVFSSSYSHCFTLNSSRSQSFLVSVRCQETYVISAAFGSLVGLLETATASSFSVFDDPVFVPQAEFVEIGTPSATSSVTHTPLPTDPCTMSSYSAAPTPQSNGISTWAIVGIAFGCVVLIVLGCITIWLFQRRLRQPKYESLDSNGDALRCDPISDPRRTTSTFTFPSSAYF